MCGKSAARGIVDSTELKVSMCALLFRFWYETKFG